MKIRTGFVSNSSTSSFVMVIHKDLYCDDTALRRYLEDQGFDPGFYDFMGQPYLVSDAFDCEQYGSNMGFYSAFLLMLLHGMFTTKKHAAIEGWVVEDMDNHGDGYVEPNRVPDDMGNPDDYIFKMVRYGFHDHDSFLERLHDSLERLKFPKIFLGCRF